MLITDDYRRQQERLHENLNYGVASLEFAPIVASIVNNLGVKELLDYGAGKGRLMEALKMKLHEPLRVHCYDPAVPRWSDRPDPCEMVACIDVLEHIEPACLDAVLDDLRRCMLQLGFFSVHTGPAVKTLEDGRNAHLIQQPMEWWLPNLWQRFAIQTVQVVAHGFYVIVHPRPENSYGS